MVPQIGTLDFNKRERKVKRLIGDTESAFTFPP